MWVEPDIRDELVDFVDDWSRKTEIVKRRFIGWIGISGAKFYDWRARYGKINDHNGKIPRDFWLRDWEKQEIIDYHQAYPGEGYRRLTYMMLDAGVVAASPATVWRVLHRAGLLRRNGGGKSKKGTGFNQPSGPHRHWHIDIAYINIFGTFYYLCSILDGYSRLIVGWDIREKMTEADVEIVIQRARESFPEARPRIISDNGPQFIARDFRDYIRLCGMTHVRTSPFYPQSNGKLERYHKSIKTESIRQKTPLSLDGAGRIIGEYVDYYNNVRLHSAIGYVTPADKLAGRESEIFAERDRKLRQARQARKQARATDRQAVNS